MTAIQLRPVDMFAKFWRLGFRNLIPIIPPDAPISERSTLFLRLKAGKDDRGKVPGVKGADGLWSGMNWIPVKADEEALARWASWGAGVGIKTGALGDGTSLVLIDADTLFEDRAAVIKEAVSSAFGVELPVRIGRYPKAGYLVRVNGPYAYTRVEFGDLNDRGQLADRVEILSDGRQFVAHGVHPVTREPYRWPRDAPALDEVPVVEPAALDALMARLGEILPAATPVKREGGSGVVVDQAGLRGDPEIMKRAIAAIPNTSARFGAREDWLNVGYAIKAGMGQEGSAEALEMFLDWSARWLDDPTGLGNDPDYVQAEWARMQPPFRVGAGTLYRLAREATEGAFNCFAEQFWEPVSAHEPLFPDLASDGMGGASARYYETLTLDQIDDLPDPVFLIDRHVPERSVGFLYGDPGTGKSFIALDWALSIAFGLPTWQGDALKARPDARVVYLAGEGAPGFKLRAAAWRKARGLEAAADDGRFRLIRQPCNFMQAEDVARLLATIRDVIGGDVDLIVIDTVSRAMPGADENLQKEMTLFVAACDKAKELTRGAVVGVHHAGKSGDMRGSTVLNGAGDFVFKLERKKGATVGRLHCEKQKDAPDGWSEAYRLGVVGLDDGRSSLVPERCEENIGPDVALTPAMTSAVLDAMRKAWGEGAPWSTAANSGDRRAVRHMVRDFGFSAESAEETLRLWEASGLIVTDILSGKSKMKGLRVVAESGFSEPKTASLFD